MTDLSCTRKAFAKWYKLREAIDLSIEIGGFRWFLSCKSPQIYSVTPYPDKNNSLSGLETTQTSPPTLSLIKELEDFVYEALGLSHQPDHPSKRSRVLSKLEEYTSVKEALRVMRQERPYKDVSQRDALAEQGAGSGCLKSLLFISAILLEREQDTCASMEPIIRPLNALDAFLLEFRHVWVDSSKDLIYLIWDKFAIRKEGAAILQSVVQITDTLKEVGHRAAWGFEQCLLECLRK